MKQDFPDIFALATNPTAQVESYLLMHGESIVWNPVLRRDVFDWELSRVSDFMRRLYGSKVLGGLRIVVFGAQGKGMSSRSNLEQDFFMPTPQALGPCKEVWYNGTPLKVQFFIRTVA